MSSYVQITRDNTILYTTNRKVTQEFADEIRADAEEFVAFLEKMRKKGVILRVQVPYRPTHDDKRIGV